MTRVSVSIVPTPENEIFLEEERSRVVRREGIHACPRVLLIDALDDFRYVAHSHVVRSMNPHSARVGLEDQNHFTLIRVDQYTWYRFVEDRGRDLDLSTQ